MEWKWKEMKDEEMVKKMLEARFYSCVAENMKQKREGLHVTHLVYSCLRRGYWMWKEGRQDEVENLDGKKILTFWIGKKIHEMPLTNKHEYKLKYNRGGLELEGTADEILESDDIVIVIDKKTTTKLPTSIYLQHQKQIEFYCAMMSEELKNRKVIGAVLYIDINEKNIAVFPFTVNIAKAKEELDSRLDAMILAERSKTVPDSEYSWLCNYCPFLVACRKLDSERFGEEFT